ncbi:Snare protein syntaxin 18/ufe1, partial [Globisporangium splendens]
MGVRRDLTREFEESVAALQAASGGGVRSKKQQQKRQMHGNPSAFDLEAVELAKSLATMEELLREIRPKYLRPKHFIRMKGAKMSEAEKDEFDTVCVPSCDKMLSVWNEIGVTLTCDVALCTQDFTELVKNCSEKIDALNDIASNSRGTPEGSGDVFIRAIPAFLAVASCTSSSDKLLLPEEVRSELSSLEDKLPRGEEKPPTTAKPAPKADSAPVLTPSLSTQPTPASEKTPLVAKTASKKPVIQQAPVFASQSDDMELTEEQERRFRVENLQLHRHFLENLEDAKYDDIINNTVVTTCCYSLKVQQQIQLTRDWYDFACFRRNMESKMSEISNLMSQFADKIMEQQADIEMIHQHATETKTNVSQRQILSFVDAVSL